MYLRSHFHLYICLKIEGCLFKVHPGHTTLPPSRQQSLQHAENLSGKKPDTCADCGSSFLSSSKTSFFQILMNTDSGVGGLVNNETFYLLRLLPNKIG